MNFSVVGISEDVTQTADILLSMSCREVIIIGINLMATGNGKVEIAIDGSHDDYSTIVHGISNGVTNTKQSAYIAELKIVGYGVLATIRSGQNEISQNAEIYTSYVPMDHVDINEIKILVGDTETGVTLVKGMFIVYGR